MIEVLCVDDEADFLKLEKEYLERSGDVQVDVAESVAEAVQMIKLKTYHAVISDYRMNGPSGLDLLRYMRSSGNNTPFIVFTGRGEDETAIDAMSEGATFFVEKGGSPLPILAEIANMLRLLARSGGTQGSGERRGEFYEAMGRAGSSMVVMVDEGGTVVDCCDRSEKVLGYRREEVVGKMFSSLVSSGESDAGATPLRDLMAGAKSMDAEAVRKNGRAIPVRITAAAFRSEERGNLSGSLYVIEDVSEKKELENHLDKARKRCEDLEEMLDDIYDESDPERKYTNVKKAS